MDLIALLFLILFLAVVIWTLYDRLLALLPGDARLKQAVRVIAIVAIALYALNIAAGLFGVSTPWSPHVGRHR